MIHSFTTREHACKILTAAITETVNRPMVFDIYGGHISQESVPIGVTQCQDCGETVFRTFGDRSSLLTCPQCDGMMKLIVKVDLVIFEGIALYRGYSI